MSGRGFLLLLGIATLLFSALAFRFGGLIDGIICIFCSLAFLLMSYVTDLPRKG